MSCLKLAHMLMCSLRNRHSTLDAKSIWPHYPLREANPETYPR